MLGPGYAVTYKRAREGAPWQVITAENSETPPPATDADEWTVIPAAGGTAETRVTFRGPSDGSVVLGGHTGVNFFAGPVEFFATRMWLDNERVNIQVRGTEDGTEFAADLLLISSAAANADGTIETEQIPPHTHSFPHRHDPVTGEVLGSAQTEEAGDHVPEVRTLSIRPLSVYWRE